MFGKIYEGAVVVFGFLKDIIAGRIVKKSNLKKDLEYGRKELNRLIIESSYVRWNSGVRTRKLETLHVLRKSIQEYGVKKLTKTDVFTKIEIAIKNIDNYKGMDDVIEICAELSSIINRI